MLSANAIALERLAVHRRTLSSVLLNADMFDRWGPRDGPEYERMRADAAEATAQHAEVSAALEALSRDLWQRDAASVTAWAEAHIDLLERFSAANADDASQSTAVFVAKGEIDEWRKVARGERGYVDENCYYVHVDPAQHAGYFGPPGE